MVSSRDKLSYGKNKLKRMESEIQERLAHVLDIAEQELKTDDENDNCFKCINLDRLVDLFQAKIAVSSRKEKIKLLTLTPESWSIQKVIKKFNATEHMAKKARALKKEHGILVEPKPKSGRALSKDVVDCVINFTVMTNIQECVLEKRNV